jgi:5'-deoxynucleotidase YfbR-like HD superfamily hydrolase
MHSINDPKSAWIQTYTGKAFYVLDPQVADIDIKDIAHALSMQCRFTGHSRYFYSVAEHSVGVSKNGPKEFALWGLLHDASEAYLTDLSRPLKQYSDLGARYREVEDRLMAVICEHFGLQLQEPPEVKVADKRMFQTERRFLMRDSASRWNETEEPYDNYRIVAMYPNDAERAFYKRFEEITG